MKGLYVRVWDEHIEGPLILPWLPHVPWPCMDEAGDTSLGEHEHRKIDMWHSGSISERCLSPPILEGYCL